MKTEDRIEVFEYDTIMESSKWLKEIPYLTFPSDWKVQVSPPFGAAVVRFRVKSKGKEVSVYLDCYDSLGYFGSPYWEVYPYDYDVYRVAMNDTKELMEAIQYAIDNG